MYVSKNKVENYQRKAKLTFIGDKKSIYLIVP